MMIKTILVLLLLAIPSLSFADTTTTFYRMIIPDIGDRDWISSISGDIISVDSAIHNISSDIGWVKHGASTRTTSPDVVSGKPTLYVSSDNTMLLYTGTYWKKVTLE